MKSFHESMMKYIKKHQLLVPGDFVLVGCSGGIDSMVLLHFLKSQQNALAISVAAVHVNHMLRGDESLEDRLFTERICKEWGIACYSRDIPIPDILNAEGGNKQQVCRTERYSYFSEVMEKSGASKLATAHHADDQLETILMAGLRGTLQSGSFGMPSSRPFESGRLIRPLLAVTKNEIAGYAEEHGISHREDPSNAEPIYTRNRIRHTVVPVLKKENADVSKQFVELSESVQEDQNFLWELAEEKLQAMMESEERGISLSAENFRAEASALQKRMVLLLLNYLYNDKQVIITKQLAEQVQSMIQSSSGTVFLHLPQNYMMVRQYDLVFFSRHPIGEIAVKDFSSITNEWSEEVNGFRYKAIPLNQLTEKENHVLWYFSAPDDLTLLLRKRKPGDRIQLAGMVHPKKVARLMIDEKVPAPLRENWPVIANGSDEILLVPGLRPSHLVSRVKRIGDNWVLIEQQVKTAKSGL